MISITVRNIPDDVMERIRALSAVDKRSLNNEILVLLEKGVFTEVDEKIQGKKHISKSAQVEIWKRLIGTWDDDRSVKQIIDDIYSHRTTGREVNL